MDLPELTDRELLLRALDRITRLEMALDELLGVVPMVDITDPPQPIRLPKEKLEGMQ